MAIYFDQSCATISPTKEWSECEDVFPMTTYYSSRNGNGLVPNIDENHTILFDRHAGLINNYDKNLEKNHSLFWELLDKANSDFEVLFSGTLKNNSTLPYEMIDSALTRVLIIDERVAQLSNEEITNHHIELALGCPVNRFKYSCAAKIYICTHLDGNPIHPDCGEFENENSDSLEVKFVPNSENSEFSLETGGSELAPKEFDCMIIHRVILNRYYEKDQMFVSKLNIPKVYVVTGGGSVNFLEDSISILSNSILNDYILGARIAKLELMRTLR